MLEEWISCEGDMDVIDSRPDSWFLLPGAARTGWGDCIQMCAASARSPANNNSLECQSAGDLGLLA